MTEPEQGNSSGVNKPRPPWPAVPDVIDSVDLFADRKEVQIRHKNELYRLRVTKNGKLILNK